MPSVAWFIPEDRIGRAKAWPATPLIPEADQRRYRYTIEGDSPPWRSSRYDDGRKSISSFRRGSRRARCHRCLSLERTASRSFVNYRAYKNVLIVDRLFAAAELRLVRISSRRFKLSETTGGHCDRQRCGATVHRNPHVKFAGGCRRPFSLLPGAICRGLSRKVLVGGSALVLLTVAGAVILAWTTNRPHDQSPDELYSTDHRKHADGLSALPRDYAGVPAMFRAWGAIGPSVSGGRLFERRAKWGLSSMPSSNV